MFSVASHNKAMLEDLYYGQGDGRRIGEAAVLGAECLSKHCRS
jgi:hypothetical protein